MSSLPNQACYMCKSPWRPLRIHATRAGKVGKLPNGVLPQGTTVNSEEVRIFCIMRETIILSTCRTLHDPLTRYCSHSQHQTPQHSFQRHCIFMILGFPQTVIRKQVLHENQCRTGNESANIQPDSIV